MGNKVLIQKVYEKPNLSEIANVYKQHTDTLLAKLLNDEKLNKKRMPKTPKGMIRAKLAAVLTEEGVRVVWSAWHPKKDRYFPGGFDGVLNIRLEKGTKVDPPVIVRDVFVKFVERAKKYFKTEQLDPLTVRALDKCHKPLELTEEVK